MDINIVRSSIRYHVHDTKKRCMLIASKWLCEQLIGMPEEKDSDECMLHDNEGDTISRKEADAITLAQTLITAGEYQRCAHLLRKLLPSTNPTNSSSSSSSSSSVGSHTLNNLNSPIAIYLAAYALYMAGERLREQEDSENGNSNSVSVSTGVGRGAKNNKKELNKDSTSILVGRNRTARNPYLNELYSELIPLYEDYRNQCKKGELNSSKMDGYLLYLFTVVVRDLRTYGSAGSGFPLEHLNGVDNQSTIPFTTQLFVESLSLNPWNWSCWLELAEECTTKQLKIPPWEDFSYQSNSLAQHNANRIMYDCFLIHLYLEQQQGDLALQVLQKDVLQVFPTSQVSISQTALAHYCLRDYDHAQLAFEIARDSDPHRLDEVHTYSNILYVKERRAELSHLAHAVSKIDKFSPESCCVIGNYYSLKGQHERAIVYFQRALRLNNQFLSAWTLMGHEFVELRNTAAAVQCYRKAVGVNPRDYRAWYGLGQTYEMLHLYQYALHYYKKAASLKPSDARMWCAVGNCLGRLGLGKDAMLALERAVSSGDREGIATRELARLYRDSGQATKAAECYHKHLQTLGVKLENPEKLNAVEIDSERAEGLLFLASYHRSKGSLHDAEEYCNLLADFVGPEGDEARAMLREIRSLRTGPKDMNWQQNSIDDEDQRLNDRIMSPDMAGQLLDSDEEM